MEFRTKISIPNYPYPIDYHSKIFGMGSCFVDNMKEKLDFYKFQNLINPFGVIFNPVSINKLIQRIIKKEFFIEKDLFFHEDLWKSFQVHSKYNTNDKHSYLKNINEIIEKSHRFLKSSDWVFITLGTSWVYKYIETDEIVANCHKVPQRKFKKLILSPTEIKSSLERLVSLIQAFNPQAKILFSISPVRHLKDGFVENNRSKSHLHTALHPLINNETTFYFPSYEILIDDLRDYRFYERDYLHPNNLALEYIWEKFKSTLISPEIYEDLKLIGKIQKQFHHKPFSKNKSILSTKQIEKINYIQKKYSHIRFE